MTKRSFVAKANLTGVDGQLILCIKGTCTLHTFTGKVQDALRGLHKRPSEFYMIYTNQWNQARCMAWAFFIWIVVNLSVLYDYEDCKPDLSHKRKVTRSVMWLLLKTSHLCVCVAGIGAQFNPWELPTLLSLSLGDDGRLPPLPPLSSPTSRISGEKWRDPWARTSIIATWISFRINLIGAHISLGIPFDLE